MWRFWTRLSLMRKYWTASSWMGRIYLVEIGGSKQGFPEWWDHRALRSFNVWILEPDILIGCFSSGFYSSFGDWRGRRTFGSSQTKLMLVERLLCSMIRCRTRLKCGIFSDGEWRNTSCLKWRKPACWCTYCSITLIAIACVSWGVKKCRHLYSRVSGWSIIVWNKIRIRIKI